MRIACYIPDDYSFIHVQSALRGAGLICRRFPSETSLMRALQEDSFELILFSADSHSVNEENLNSWLNSCAEKSIPLVLLSSECSAEQVVLALDAGADDLISPSCNPIVLVARLQAILRRSHCANTRRLIELSGFSLDLESSRLLDNGVEVELTPREFKIAWLLFSSFGTYLTRETISMAIWGVGSEITNRTIEQHVYKLRKKLKLGEERGLQIRTAYTNGYCLEYCKSESKKSVDRSAGSAPAFAARHG
ncbi:MAG TPA: response regulator transcription factor [Noviherbaspirillum sp.]|nr:response regulator transcription factor [Noviherbaspirillum sp.]